MKVHFIGIGGTGLSAIARLLLEKGYRVSGSDRVLSPLAQSLQRAGVAIFEGHRAENIQSPDIVVRSSAVKDDNPEVIAARNAGIPVLKRSEFLGQLIQNDICIAVAGTHGKTTTTAMIAWMLTAMGKQPSYIIGGISKNLGTNAHFGKDGGYFVIEADEYDRMFLGLQPAIMVVTNIRHDHPDCFPTPQVYLDTFKEFSSRLIPNGTLITCGDDSGSDNLAEYVAGQEKEVKVIRYGIDQTAKNQPNDYFTSDMQVNNSGGFDYHVYTRGQDAIIAKVRMKIPGIHNVLNSLAALIVADQLRLPLADAAQALSQFTGTDRRFDLRGEPCGIAVIDDYAHHPDEIKATLQSARLRYPNRRIWVVWQPHTFSRIQALYGEFLNAFSDADRVIVTEVYAARENTVAFSTADLANDIQHPNVIYIPALSTVTSYLLEKLQAGDVVLVLSAGDADVISANLIQELSVI